jgi:DNA-directed RNA polymerase specialized sigma24 family protein
MQHHYRLALATARDAVAPKTFETFMLLVEGLSAAETAQRQGITLDAVYKVKQRMRERLQEALDAQFEDEEHRERSE